MDAILHPRPPPGKFDSQIISEFPEIFAEFRGKQFKLLWRGSRGGFSASEFHGRCDGHANTLTVKKDTLGNIFGGFTPAKWESRKYGKEDNQAKADGSEKSFIFILKNGHNLDEQRFGLTSEEKWREIYFAAEIGSCFGSGKCGICVSDNCNANTNSYSYGFGRTYANDTGLNGRTFLSGSEKFRVKEIEVFEITD
jgi:hypothetical protein